MIVNKLGRGILALNRFGITNGLTKTRSVHYRGEFWDKNINRLHRPLSPHLSAYRMPFTGLTSITFRICGACMTVAVLSFGAGSFYFAGNFDKILDWFQQNVHPYGLLAMKFVLSFPIVWHPIFGIRHLVWDSGRHYPLKNIMTSGRIMMALAIVGTIVLALSDL